MVLGCRWLISATMLVALAWPAQGLIFGRSKLPVPQWGLDAAKTPTPAYAKNASAVILYDEYIETVDGAGRAVEREREAIRILQPQGRGSTCGVSYDVDEKVNHFHAWAILADGRPYEAEESDFREEGDTGVPVMLSTRKERVVHLPVDVGSVEICETDELLEPYRQETNWHIQNEIPVVFEALEVDLPPGRSYSMAWHRHAAEQPVEVAANHWRWEIKDMPALDLRDIPSHPEWAALAARMSVQWGDAAVAGTENQWRAIGAWVTQLESDRPTPSPEIVSTTETLISGAPDFYAKLSRIAEYVQQDIRYFVVTRGISGLQANHAADIFRNRYGDCKDKTTLMIAMLRVAGISAFYVPVDDRRGVVDAEEPSLLGNHMITAIEIPSGVEDARLLAVVKGENGKRYLIFDPTNQHTAIGNLPSYEQGSYGTLAAGAASQVIALPVLAPEANGSERKGEFSLLADGTLEGKVDSSHVGPTGGDLRAFLNFSDEKERRDAWEHRIAESVPDVVLDSFEFVQPASLDKPLEFHYTLTARQYAHTAGTLLLVRPRVVGSDTLPVDTKARTVGIDLEATGHWRDVYEIHLPEGYVVDDLPDEVKLDTDFASYHARYSVKDKVLRYEREYEVKKVEIPAERQPEFLRFESRVGSDERATAVLKKE